MKTTRKISSQIVLVLGLSLGLSPPLHGQPPVLSQDAIYLLTALDGVPTRAQLQVVFPDGVTTLMQIAAGADDVGIRIRAIRALAQYPAAINRAELLQLLPMPDEVGQQTEQGEKVLIALAVLETLGRVGNADEVPRVASLLKHPSRDVRVSVARALRQIGAVSAVEALRERQRNEVVAAVRLAITEAIQALGQPP